MAVVSEGMEIGDGLSAVGRRIQSSSQLRASDFATSEVPSFYEIQTAFGTPSEVGAGFIGILNPGGAGIACYLCASDGTTWWSLLMTAPPT